MLATRVSDVFLRPSVVLVRSVNTLLIYAAAQGERAWCMHADGRGTVSDPTRKDLGGYC